MADEPKPPKPYVPPQPDEATRLYWDRLDAKFANAKAPPPTPPEQPSAEAAPAPVASPPVPYEPVSYEPVSYEPVPPAPAPPASAPSAPVPSAPAPPASAPSASASGLIAEAFAALLALEDGEPGAQPVRLTTGADQPPPAVEPKITDAVIEDVVRRVIERLGPDAVRAVVVDVVSQISERLVKEEIDRIRKQHV
jgi:hypothetical protein